MIDEHYLSMVIVGRSVFELTNGDLRAAGVLPKPSCRQNMLYNLFMLSFSSMIKIYIKLFCWAVCNRCDQLHTGSTTCSIHIRIQEQINNKTPLLKNTSTPARTKTTKALRSRSLSAKTTPLIYASMKHFTLESISLFWPVKHNLYRLQWCISCIYPVNCLLNITRVSIFINFYWNWR